MKLLIFHPVIAPYRIGFFNRLYDNFEANICPYYRNMKSQTFDYDKIEAQFHFKPEYFGNKGIKIGKRCFYPGHIKRIRKYKPDLVLVGEYNLGLWAAVLYRFFSRKKYKIVTVCDDSLKIAEDCSGRRKLSRNLAVRCINGVILCNRAVEDWYNRHFTVKTFVFPIIQPEEDYYKDKEEALGQASQNIAEFDLYGKRIFLFVGRIINEKNPEYLLRSFIKQHEEHPENVIFIVGGESNLAPSLPAKLQEIIDEASAEDYIRILGRKEGTELKAWYYTSQVFVLPSVYEPFGAVTNEALLAGNYVMVSKNAGSSCLVTEDNGEVIDIDRDFIDFGPVSGKIPVLSADSPDRENRMPYSYDEKMEGLMAWLDGIR